MLKVRKGLVISNKLLTFALENKRKETVMATFYKKGENLYKVEETNDKRWAVTRLNKEQLELSTEIVTNEPTDLGEVITSTEWDKTLLANFWNIKVINNK